MNYKLKDADEFWRLCGEKLVSQLSNMNLPIVETEQADDLFFCQAYYKENGKVYPKWITDMRCFIEEPPEYRYDWSFSPKEIGPREDSLDSVEPNDQLYFFDVECYAGDGNVTKIFKFYQDIMIATFDGTVLAWGDKTRKAKTLDSLPTFPKSMLAKINRCLANNFLPDLWVGDGYAKWHRTDEGIYRYMLT